MHTPPNTSTSKISKLFRFAFASIVPVSMGIFISSFGTTGCATDEYRCDSTGCYLCDGYGCREVVPPTPQTCGVKATDKQCRSNEVCTASGCLVKCTNNEQCAQGYTCQEGLCSSPKAPPQKELQCARNADCGTDAQCVDGKCASMPACAGVGCVCKYSSDCGENRICVDGKCERSCDALNPCPSGSKCSTSGRCEPDTQSKATCGVQANGATCATGQHCVDGQCVAGCAANSDCKGAGGVADPGQECVAGACVQSSKPMSDCQSDTQCKTGTQKCVDGLCRYTCSTSEQCKAIFWRIGACSPSEGICRQPEDLSVTCTSKADCGAKSCVNGQCK